MYYAKGRVATSRRRSVKYMRETLNVWRAASCIKKQPQVCLSHPSFMDSFSEAGSANSLTSDASDESDWLDEHCLSPPKDGSGLSGSGLCPACNHFFHAYKLRYEYNHIRLLSTLQLNIVNQCPLCTLIWSKIDKSQAKGTAAHEIKLTYMIDDSLIEGAIELFVSYYLHLSSSLLDTDSGLPEQACSVIRLVERKGLLDLTYGRSRDLLTYNSGIEHLVSGHDYSDNTGSHANKQLALKWLQACKMNHTKCNYPKTHLKWLPTRLVTIDSIGREEKARVIEPNHDSPHLEYMALSHCWGLKPILTLNAQSKSSLERGVLVALLPRTFREALEIIKWFGIQYIWIDSLCILQDSDEDWQREASLMKDVYKNAMGTIAATGALDSSVGCFFARDPEIVRGFCIPGRLIKKNIHDLFCFDSEIWEEGVDRAPLNQRAWVVQERLLSRRVVHFSQQQLFWECHELNACEMFPGGLEKVVPDITIGFKNLHSMSTSEKRLAPQWERVTRAYSKAALTKASDKIIALAGIATEMESVLNDNYLAGLWARNLPEQLVWQVVGDKTKISRPSLYRAPSWSWLSIDTAVEPSTTFNDPVLIKVSSAAVKSVPGRELSHIQSGFIRLRGVLTGATWRRTSSTSKVNESIVLLFDEQELDSMYVNLDYLHSRLSSTVYCLPIVPQRYNDLEGRISTEGLVLHATGEAEYQRIGYFRAQGRETCEIIEQGSRTQGWKSSSQEKKWVGEHLPLQELVLI